LFGTRAEHVRLARILVELGGIDPRRYTQIWRGCRG
jgi:hypothetical protein